jgi:hypothetical protein
MNTDLYALKKEIAQIVGWKPRVLCLRGHAPGRWPCAEADCQFYDNHGRPLRDRWRDCGCDWIEPTPSYATDPAASKELLDWLEEKDWSVMMARVEGTCDGDWIVSVFVESPQKAQVGDGQHPNRCTALALAVVDAFRAGGES